MAEKVGIYTTAAPTSCVTSVYFSQTWHMWAIIYRGRSLDSFPILTPKLDMEFRYYLRSSYDAVKYLKQLQGIRLVGGGTVEIK